MRGRVLSLLDMLVGLALIVLCIYSINELSEASNLYHQLAELLGFAEDEQFKASYSELTESLMWIHVLLWLVLALGITSIVWSLVTYTGTKVPGFLLIGTNMLILILLLISASLEAGAFTVFFETMMDLDSQWDIEEKSIYSTQSMLVGYFSALYTVFLCIPVIIRMLPNRYDDDDDWYEEDKLFKMENDASMNPYLQPTAKAPTAPPKSPPRSPPPEAPTTYPDTNWYGEFDDDGYEWIEHPQNSNNWFWRDPNSGYWERY